MGPSGAADSGGEARRATAHDRYAFGDERDLLSPANRLPLALFAARGLSAAFDGLQHLSRFPAGGVWEAIWEELRAALRERLGREASPSAGVVDSQSLRSAEKGDARKAKQTQWVMTPARG